MADLIEKRSSAAGNIRKLTLGMGKVSMINENESVDIHLHHRDFDNLIVTRTRPKLMFTSPRTNKGNTTGSMEPKRAGKDVKENEISLSKTYLTKSGMMLLYSDRKIMKDKSSEKENIVKDHLDVMGRAIARPKSGASNSKLAQIVGKRKDRQASARSSNEGSCRDKDRYIKSRATFRSHCTEPIPYLWNYSVSSMRVAGLSNKNNIKTVKGLSEAVLSYGKEEVVDADTCKYLERIKEKWKDRTDVEKQELILAGRFRKVNDWTRDWIHVHRTFLRESTTQHIDSKVPVDDKKPEPKPEREPKRITFAWNMDYNKYSRAPVNTPLSFLPRSYTRTGIMTEKAGRSSV